MTGLLRGRIVVCSCVLVVVGCFSLVSPAHSLANFDVRQDAFSISNAPGWCFAMAAFSRWYYLTQQEGVPLRHCLDKRCQQRIAKELQGYYSRNLVKIQADYCNQSQEHRRESFRRFITGLATGEPRIVLLMSRTQKGVVLHAVLAYAWLPESETIKVYDPNYCDSERFIDMERGEYTSLDITYDAFCFPEVLHDHPALVKKMESLYRSCSVHRAGNEDRRSVSTPLVKRISTEKRRAN